MTSERKLIHDATPGGLCHDLLLAGREAAPGAESRERLLDALLPGGVMPAPRAGASKSSIGGNGIGSLKPASWAKLVGVGVVAAAAAFYASRRTDRTVAVTQPVDSMRVDSTASDSTAGDSKAPPTAPMLEGEVGSVARDGAAASPDAMAVAPKHATDARPLAVQAPARHERSRAKRSRHALASQEAQARTNEAPAAFAPPPPVQPSLEDTRLGAELRQLDAVRSAVSARNPALAERLLTEYRAQFPAGYLAPEARRLQTLIRALSD